WRQQFDKTYDLMANLKDELAENDEPTSQLRRAFENHCVKSKKVINTVKEELSFFEAIQKLKKQVTESKRFVANQLQGVSEVIEKTAKENIKERQNQKKKKIHIDQA